MSSSQRNQGDAQTLRILDLKNIRKSFGPVAALKGIDLDVLAGEVHCLAGENGCGKSTLIKIVSGVHRPDPGSIVGVNGTQYSHLTPALARREGIQVIFQDLSLFPNLTVADNIAFGQVVGGFGGLVPHRHMLRQASSIIERLGVDIDLSAPVGSLPIAQRQIVAICRGLVADAKLIFMDEPTASLTGKEVEALLAIVEQLRKQGLTIVFVSHRLDEVVDIADRVTVLRDGAKVGTYPASEIDADRLAELMTGRTIHRPIVARSVTTAPVLSVSKLSRAGEYHDVTFDLKRGEVLGLIGLLGSGRTELAMSLFGMTRPDSGTMLYDGAAVHFQNNRDAIDQGIAYLPEDRLTLGLNLRQSIGDNIIQTILPRLSGPLGIISDKQRNQHANTWIERLKIKTASAGNAVQTLSGGNQQRVVIAKWLATQPKVLILDSPTVGVDIGNKQDIYALIREIAEQGVAVLVISDEISEIFSCCDRALQMRNGVVCDEFVPGEVAEEDIKERIYARHVA